MSHFPNLDLDRDTSNRSLERSPKKPYNAHIGVVLDRDTPPILEKYKIIWKQRQKWSKITTDDR